MRELFKQVLTDVAARDSEVLPNRAASVASEFLPWLGEEAKP